MKPTPAFKALADPSRRRILQILSEGDRSAGELAKDFDMSLPSMSHHFNVLKEADLVSTRRIGQQIIYSLNTSVFEEIVAVLLDLTAKHRKQKRGRHED